ncbi:visual pigment-like receptor peropsin [Oculina patagonica]
MIFVTWIYICLIAPGFILNTITILTFNKNRHLLTVSDLPILSIAIADGLLAVFVMPFSAVANFRGTWPFGISGCSLYACVNAIVGFGTMLHHTVLAVEKCWKTHHPMTADLTRKQMLKIIAFLWGFAALLGILPLFGWSSYGEEGAICSIKWRSVEIVDFSYIICIFVIFFLAPIVSIVVSYAIIFYDLHQMVKRGKREWGNEAQQTLEVVLGQKKVALTAFIMIASFIVVWTPYGVVSFYFVFGKPEHISPLASTIPAIFAKISVFLNPIVYVIRYKRFREGVKKLFKELKFSNNSIYPNEGEVA